MVGESTDKCAGAVGPIQQGWIVKVDSNGCVGPGDPQCWPAAVPGSPEKPTVSVRPNPVKDTWYIDNKQGKQLNVTITDIAGRVIVSKTLSSVLIPTDLSAFPTGMYLFRINSEKGILLQGKLLKE
jgi:hypothetical protein